MQKLRKLVVVIVFTLNTCLLFSVCSISLVASVMLSILLNYPVMYLLSEREREAVNMKRTVFTARLIIYPTIKNLICRSLLYDCEM